jgi:hypothetical protein
VNVVVAVIVRVTVILFLGRRGRMSAAEGETNIPKAG